MPAAESLVVFVTASGEEEAERLARLLLQQRLVACASILPHVRSLFHWDGRLECAAESLLLLKTTAEALTALTETVRTNHSYDVPEIIAIPVCGGSADYLSWVRERVRPADLGPGGA